MTYEFFGINLSCREDIFSFENKHPLRAMIKQHLAWTPAAERSILILKQMSLKGSEQTHKNLMCQNVLCQTS